MFNSYEESLKLRKLCDYKKVNLIEDNAIYFDNFIQKKNKTYSGSIGHYSLYSFNLMKNISALYGGGVSTNDNNFYNFAKKEIANFGNFSIYIYTRQMLIYVILKILSVNFIYKFFFFSIIKFAYKKNINDTRNSPALKIISLFFRNNTHVDFYDPYVKYINVNNKKMHTISLNKEQIILYDAVLIVTDHDKINYKLLVKNSKYIFDARGKLLKENNKNILYL
jgi:hypothetical protein